MKCKECESKKNKKMCSKCNEYKDLKEFYMASSTLLHSDGKLGICKQCLNNLVDFDDISTIKQALRLIDRPFLIEEYEGVISSRVEKPNANLFGEYMRRLAMKQNRELTWNDSVFDKDDTYDEFEIQFENTSSLDMNDLVKFFGKGFTEEDYYWLHEEFEDFTTRYQSDSKGMDLIIKEICLTQLDIKKRREKGEKVDAQLKTLQDLLGSGNLKPVQETGANAVDQETFGTLIKKYENERPIPQPDPEWEDVDGIGKYIRTFFLGHLTRMVGVKNQFEEEYWKEIDKYTVQEPNEDVSLDD